MKKSNQIWIIIRLVKPLKKFLPYLINLINLWINQNPGILSKQIKKLAARDLSILIESFRVIGIILKPYIPDASEKILDFLNVKDENRDFKFIDFKYKLKKGHCINDPEPLFPRYE